MELTSDAEPVAQAAAGDEEAFCLLVRKYQNYAYGTAIGIVSDLDLAQDVVQEAFLSAYLNLAKLRTPERFGPWLRSIVRSMAFRVLRERQHTRALVAAYGQTTEGYASPTPVREEPDDEPDAGELVRGALERLEPRNREAVSLYYINGMSYDDVAQFLGVTRATVKGRLQRARAQMREEIEMVKKTFKEKELPEDFAAEIGRLLSAWKERGKALDEEINRMVEIGEPAVDPLCRALDDADFRVRRAASSALGAIRAPRSLEPILSALREERIHRTAPAAAIPGAREACLRALREGNPEDQLWALRTLRHFRHDEEVYQAILEAFYKMESPRRNPAADILCRINPDAVVPILDEALNDPDIWTRGWAAFLAFKYRILPSPDACLNALLKGVSWNPWPMAHVVRRHGEILRPRLQKAFREGNHDEQFRAALALAAPGQEDVFAFFMKELEPKGKWLFVIDIVAQGLAWNYGPRLVAWLAENPNRQARLPMQAIIRALAKSPYSEGGELIEQLARTGELSVRAASLRILTRQKKVDMLPELRALLREGKPGKVARQAFWQMLHLRDYCHPPSTREAVLATTEEMLTSEHWGERRAAVALLRRWKKLTPAQRDQALQDSNPAVRNSVVFAKAG